MALGGRYGTHWHQPLLPLGPMRVTKGDRFSLEVPRGGSQVMACFRKSLGDSLVFWGHEGGFFWAFSSEIHRNWGIFCGVWCFFRGSLKQTREVVKDIAKVHEH